MHHQKSVLIAVPAYGGMITTATFDSLMSIAMALAHAGVDSSFLTVGGEAAITRGRSNIASTFLRNDFDVLAMIDADIGIHAAYFMRLYELDKPIRGAAVNLKTDDHTERLNVFSDGERIVRDEMPDEPFEVDLLGGAVMFIEREVLKSLSSNEELKYVDPINGLGTHVFHEMIRDRTLLTEDYAFCTRAREAGFSIWVDPAVKVRHLGPSYWEF